MTSNTVVVLENLLSVTSSSINRLIVSGGCPAGVDRGGVNDEGDAKRAKYGSIFDDAVSPKEWLIQSDLHRQCNGRSAEQRFIYSVFFKKCRKLLR
jgi:hypothetical protein